MGEGAGTSLYMSGCLSVCLPMATSVTAMACLPKDSQAVAGAQMQLFCLFGSQWSGAGGSECDSSPLALPGC